MPNTILAHGAKWYNNDEVIHCPECESWTEHEIEIITGNKKLGLNVVIEGPGALVTCSGCGCIFFCERDK